MQFWGPQHRTARDRLAGAQRMAPRCWGLEHLPLQEQWGNWAVILQKGQLWGHLLVLACQCHRGDGAGSFTVVHGERRKDCSHKLKQEWFGLVIRKTTFLMSAISVVI